MRSHAKAEILCETKARRPLINPKWAPTIKVRERSHPDCRAIPKPIHTIRAEKVGWGHPVMRAKLADAYSRAEGDDEKAARILGVSVQRGWPKGGIQARRGASPTTPSR